VGAAVHAPAPEPPALEEVPLRAGACHAVHPDRAAAWGALHSFGGGAGPPLSAGDTGLQTPKAAVAGGPLGTLIQHLQRARAPPIPGGHADVRDNLHAWQSQTQVAPAAECACMRGCWAVHLHYGEGVQAGVQTCAWAAKEHSNCRLGCSDVGLWCMPISSPHCH
jgi:hypothetical protein